MVRGAHAREKVLNGGNSALAASVWEEFCNDEGIKCKPEECETYAMVTFLRIYTERVLGSEAERDRGQDSAAPSGLHHPARSGVTGGRQTGADQLRHHRKRGPREEAPPPTARSDMAW